MKTTETNTTDKGVKVTKSKTVFVEDAVECVRFTTSASIKKNNRTLFYQVVRIQRGESKPVILYKQQRMIGENKKVSLFDFFVWVRLGFETAI